MIPDTMTDRFPLGSCSYEDGGGGRYGGGCIELRSGSLTLNGGGQSPNLRVVLKVYRTSLEHFAVLYPDKLVTCCKPIGFINLKNCNVGCWRRTLQIAQRSCDGGVLNFDCADVKDVKMWLDVLDNKSATKNSNATTSSTNKRMSICTNINLPMVQEEATDMDEE